MATGRIEAHGRAVGAHPPTTARLAVAAIFMINGAVLATWAPRIPSVQQQLGLSYSALGLALLATAVGALLAMSGVGWVIARLGSQRVTHTMAVANCASLALLGLAPNLLTLVVALLLLGATNGALDVAMNTQAVAVEKRYSRPIMSSFHGLFSVGGLIGAATSGAIAARGVTVMPHLVVTSVVLGVLALIASRWLLPQSGGGTGATGFMLARPTRALFGLGIVAFCVLIGEGAMSDWSAVYVRRGLGASIGLAGAAYAAFSLGMAVGRLTGDRLNLRVGPVALVRLGGALAALSLSVALLFGGVGDGLLAVVAFAGVGAGLATIFPNVLSAAGRMQGDTPGYALAAASTAGYLGFLIGPPLIGFTAESLTLRGALGLIVASSIAVMLLANALATPDARPR